MYEETPTQERVPIQQPIVNRRRGRPKDSDVKARDKAVAGILAAKGPLTRDEISAALGISKSHVYLSLTRLRRDGSASRVIHVRKPTPARTWQITETFPHEPPMVTPETNPESNPPVEFAPMTFSENTWTNAAE